MLKSMNYKLNWACLNRGAANFGTRCRVELVRTVGLYVVLTVTVTCWVVCVAPSFDYLCEYLSCLMLFNGNLTVELINKIYNTCWKFYSTASVFI